MFGKLMSIPDELMANYFTLLTSVPQGEIAELTSAAQTHPMEAKKRLAIEITSAFHDEASANRARQEWEKIHQKKASASSEVGLSDEARGFVVPEDTPTVPVSTKIVRINQDGTHIYEFDKLRLIVACNFAASNNEARRLIAERGIRLNGEVITDPHGGIVVKTGDVLQRGKRKFVRLQVLK